MPNDIKSLLDDIINDTDTSYPDKHEMFHTDDDNEFYHHHHHHHHDHEHHKCFDKEEYKHKLSMHVLKDIVCAMMHDETKDLDTMIDEAIERHMRDNHHGSCYDYLKSSCEKLDSPVLGDIIQEIDDKADDVSEEISRKKDPDVAADVDVDVKHILNNVDNYEDLRIKLKDAVSKQVIADVTRVITKSNDAPVFDDLDKKLNTQTDNTDAVPVPDTPEKDVTNESVILRVCGAIVSECAMDGNRITTEEGINRAIVEYCIAEMDSLFKQKSRINIYSKYL
jgi:hypothetical protein